MLKSVLEQAVKRLVESHQGIEIRQLQRTVCGSLNITEQALQVVLDDMTRRSMLFYCGGSFGGHYWTYNAFR